MSNETEYDDAEILELIGKTTGISFTGMGKLIAEGRIRIRCRCGNQFDHDRVGNLTCPRCYQQYSLSLDGESTVEEEAVEPISLEPDPFRSTRKFPCPECETLLPIDEKTECSRCGAHITLCTRVDVPGIKSGDSQ